MGYEFINIHIHAKVSSSVKEKNRMFLLALPTILLLNALWITMHK